MDHSDHISEVAWIALAGQPRAPPHVRTHTAIDGSEQDILAHPYGTHASGGMATSISPLGWIRKFFQKPLMEHRWVLGDENFQKHRPIRRLAVLARVLIDLFELHKPNASRGHLWVTKKPRNGEKKQACGSGGKFTSCRRTVKFLAS